MELKNMNSNVLLSLFVIIVTIITYWAWKIINHVWFTPKKLEKWLRKNGFKGNTYRIWHGDLEDLKKMTSEASSKSINLSDDILPKVLPFYHHILQKYGKNSYYWQGPVPRLFIMDPEILREILYKPYIFQKPTSQTPVFRLLVSGIVFHEGDRWIKHRTLLNPAFKLDKIKNMLPAIEVSCKMMMTTLENWCRDKGNKEIDIWPILGNLSADVISRTAFGSSYEEGKKIFQLQTEQAGLTFSVSQSNYIPGWRFLPTRTNRRMNAIHDEVIRVMRGITDRRMRESTMRDRDDLLGLLMESNVRAVKKGGDCVGLTIDEVIEECKLFYFAGQETTSNLLSFAIVMLCTHGDWQERARQEVFRVFGESIVEPDFEKISQLKVITMILYEVLRLYPPAPITFRKAVENVELGGVTIPANDLELVIPIMFVHHDTQIWGDDAKEFNPNRFAQGIEKATKGNNDSKACFFPFSLGPRVCIGQHLALTEAKLALAMILQKFSLELGPSYVHAPINIMTLQPQHGVNVILNKI